MHVHVAGNAEAAQQVHDRVVVAEQVVHFHERGPVGPQQARQRRQFRGQGEAQVRGGRGGAVADQAEARHGRVAARVGRPRSRRPGAARSDGTPSARRAPTRARTACSTPPPLSWVTRIDAAAPPPARQAGAEAGGVEPPARRRQRVGAAMGGDQGVVAGMQPVQQGEVALQQSGARGAERGAAEMGDEHAGHGDVAPAEMAGAQAEIVLLAVALGEQVLAEQAGGVEAVAADVHAEADRGRDVDRGPRVRRGGEAAEAGSGRAVGRRVGVAGSRDS